MRSASLAVAVCLASACGEGSGSPDADLVDGPSSVDADSFLDTPLGELPPLLSEVGLYSNVLDRAVVERAVSYEPLHPLWSNGSRKERFIVLPKGEAIDASDRGRWYFPVGTLLFKTFSYFSPTSMDAIPVETRLLRRRDDGWDFVAYQWRDDSSDAELLSGTQPTKVDVTDAEQGSLVHSIPSRLECRICHESTPAMVLGLNELQLAPDLEHLSESGHLAGPVPQDPDSVSHEDEATREVLGYFEGNCSHCHNGGTGPNNSFDLRHAVALDNIVGQPTQGLGSADGLRVDPGSPLTSVLFQAFSGESENPELKLMPPVGVQRRDEDAIEDLRQWILDLPSSP